MNDGFLFPEFATYTVKDLTNKDSSGSFLAYELASEGQLKTIPRHLFTPELLETTNPWGQTVLHAAARTDFFDQVPPEILCERYLLAGDESGRSPIFWLASGRKLSVIPVHLITEAILLKGDEWGLTPLHCVAENGDFNFIAENVLTPKCLLYQDYQDNTPLHRAAMSGRLSSVPVNLLTMEAFVMRNEQGDTPLSIAFFRDQLESIPISFAVHNFPSLKEALTNEINLAIANGESQTDVDKHKKSGRPWHISTARLRLKSVHH